MDNFLIAKATDVGIARQLNEDSMTVFDSPNGQVLAVCDGMGGQAAGDVASQLTVNIIENILTDNTFETPEDAIKRSIIAANQGVLNRAAQNPEQEGMGSTCVMLIIKNGRVHCGWVGDSRIYYIANHTIRQISHDQSFVQELIDSGQISVEEAANHPQKNEITNCIGLQGMTTPQTIADPITPEPGSIFLLCSDGLSSFVDERHIERIVSNSGMTLQQKAEKLIAAANEAGGLDNITVELVQFGTSEVAGATSGTLFETPEGVNNAKKKSRRFLYSMIGIIVLALLCLIGVYVYSHQQEKKQEAKKEIKTGTTTKPSGASTRQKPAKNNNATHNEAPEQPKVEKTTNPKTQGRNSGNRVSTIVNRNRGNGNVNNVENAINGNSNNSDPNPPKDVPEILNEKDK